MPPNEVDDESEIAEVIAEVLYREVERRWPPLRRRFVLISGDILSPDSRAFLEEAGLPSLTKPFTPADVHRVVRETFGTASPTP